MIPSKTKKINEVAVLIPAYQPGPELIKLVSVLSHHFEIIIIINDGSTSDEAEETLAHISKYQNLTTVNHDRNKGKGAAIKTGIAEVLTKFTKLSYFVTADADGQHRPEDIVNVALSLTNQFQSDLVMGVRGFKQNTPFKSYFGNTLTSKIFKNAYGVDLPDTQTGLRGFNCNIAKNYLEISENGYEFETSSLIYCLNNNINIINVPITTVYHDGNSSSHFNPYIDSVKIYKVILGYTLSAVICFLIDFLFFLILLHTVGDIFFATIISRMISGIANFILNYHILKSSQNFWFSAIKYLFTFIIVMFLSAYIVIFLSNIGLPVALAKILTDTSLFVAVYKLRSLIY
ncbi:bifunctional glycosyltransferase family 2/GtrA family protein [Amylibacter sp.]|nr:bifunctional glycosyltransferase family 2/GtrA family protein [Amylibacter sp.]